MPKTIHVTVTYSVYIEDSNMSNKDALIHAKENFETEGVIFDAQAHIFEIWQAALRKVRKGRGSY
jgi:hypothetical protein